MAFVALRDGVVANEQELRDHAAKRLADLKVPEKIVCLPSLPKGVTGKIQRRTLKSLLSFGSHSALNHLLLSPE